MEITTKLLADLGADPKIYSAEERIRMGEYADKVIGGELSAIVNAIKFPTDDFNSAKKMYGDRLASLMDTVRSISAEADKLADLLSQKNSIFTSEISETERSSILSGASVVIESINALREKALDHVFVILSVMNELFDIQHVYNKGLAELGLISIAAQAAQAQGVEYDEEKIIGCIVDAYEKLCDLTAFTNDLKDKAVICQTAAEEKILDSVTSITKSLDFANDGASMNTSAAINEVIKIKNTVADVLHSQI